MDLRQEEECVRHILKSVKKISSPRCSSALLSVQVKYAKIVIIFQLICLRRRQDVQAPQGEPSGQTEEVCSVLSLLELGSL